MTNVFNKLGWVLAAIISLTVLASLSGLVFAGPPDPPGPPGSTMKTLTEVEPRTPIESLPYTISATGSYYLTGNLTAPACSGNPSQNGITISADSVTLDLDGFQLLGPGPSSGCGSGILVTQVAAPCPPGGSPCNAGTIVIKNGTVAGWGSYGIDANFADYSTFANFTVSVNGWDGIVLGKSAHASDCYAIINGLNAGTNPEPDAYGSGISSRQSDALVANCSADYNPGGGISGVASCTGCTASENGTTGFEGINTGTCERCAAINNGGVGISASESCTNCTASANDATGIYAFGSCTKCTGTSNADRGIQASNCDACVAFYNTGAGIAMSSGGGRASNCLVAGNEGGGITGSASQCVVQSNGGAAGISLDYDGSADGNNVYGNAGVGIQAPAESSGCTISGNSVQRNNGGGISLASGAINCRVTDNTVSGNAADGAPTVDGIAAAAAGCAISGNTSGGNDGNGISLASTATGCKVTGNDVNANESDGIDVTGDNNGIEENQVSNNLKTGIAVSGAGNTIVNNGVSNNGAASDVAPIALTSSAMSNNVQGNTVVAKGSQGPNPRCIWVMAGAVENNIVQNVGTGAYSACFDIASGNTSGPTQWQSTPLSNPWANIWY